VKRLFGFLVVDVGSWPEAKPPNRAKLDRQKDKQNKRGSLQEASNGLRNLPRHHLERLLPKHFTPN
jgi:hypothetical protein